MEKLLWDKIRILVINGCNYRCPFCHNEGQERNGKSSILSLDDLKKLVDILENQSISELNFSGGEPFLNKDIIDMICYANEKLSCDISCATNLSVISTEQIERLSNTRVKFNIQFPYINKVLFKQSTGNGDLQKILNNIQIVKSYGINIGLNMVIQSNNMKHVEDMIVFAIDNELPLKLLPQIGLSESSHYKTAVYPILKKYNAIPFDKGSGAVKWLIDFHGHKTTVLYIDSPCFDHDIHTCRNFGEIRILPDLSMQSCIQKGPSAKLDFSKGALFVISQFNQLWNDFKTC